MSRTSDSMRRPRTELSTIRKDVISKLVECVRANKSKIDVRSPKGRRQQNGRHSNGRPMNGRHRAGQRRPLVVELLVNTVLSYISQPVGALFIIVPKVHRPANKMLYRASLSWHLQNDRYRCQGGEPHPPRPIQVQRVLRHETILGPFPGVFCAHNDTFLCYGGGVCIDRPTQQEEDFPPDKLPTRRWTWPEFGSFVHILRYIGGFVSPTVHLRVSRIGGKASIVNHRLYVVGGSTYLKFDANDHLGDFDLFAEYLDLDSLTWQSCPRITEHHFSLCSDDWANLLVCSCPSITYAAGNNLVVACKKIVRPCANTREKRLSHLSSYTSANELVYLTFFDAETNEIIHNARRVISVNTIRCEWTQMFHWSLLDRLVLFGVCFSDERRKKTSRHPNVLNFVIYTYDPRLTRQWHQLRVQHFPNDRLAPRSKWNGNEFIGEWRERLVFMLPFEDDVPMGYEEECRDDCRYECWSCGFDKNRRELFWSHVYDFDGRSWNEEFQTKSDSRWLFV